MIFITLFMGIACGSVADMPAQQCGAPAVQFVTTTDSQQAKRDLVNCNLERLGADAKVQERNATASVVVWCEQRIVGQ